MTFIAPRKGGSLERRIEIDDGDDLKNRRSTETVIK